MYYIAFGSVALVVYGIRKAGYNSIAEAIYVSDDRELAARACNQVECAACHLAGPLRCDGCCWLPAGCCVPPLQRDLVQHVSRHLVEAGLLTPFAPRSIVVASFYGSPIDKDGNW
jgi:hypothetical protein